MAFELGLGTLPWLGRPQVDYPLGWVTFGQDALGIWTPLAQLGIPELAILLQVLCNAYKSLSKSCRLLEQVLCKSFASLMQVFYRSCATLAQIFERLLRSHTVLILTILETVL